MTAREMQMLVRAFMALLFALLGTSTIEAQSYLWFEPQVALEKSESNKVVTGEYFGTISFGHQWTPWVGLFAQTAHGNIWGETAFGPSFQISEDLNVGVGVGKEHFAPNPLRLRFNAYYDHSEGSFVYLQVDTDTSGRNGWVWADAAYMVNDHFGIGTLIQVPGGGGGPKVEIRTAQGHLGLWIAPVYEWKERKFRTLVGGRVMF